MRSKKRKTFVTFHTFSINCSTHTQLHVHVDPGNGKLTFLYILLGPYIAALTHNLTYMYSSWKRKTHVTFHTFSTVHCNTDTQLHVHVDQGNGKLTLLSILSVYFAALTHNFTYM